MRFDEVARLARLKRRAVVDRGRPQVEIERMKRWLCLLFAFAALFGLLGQEAALANASPTIPSEQVAAASQMDPGCAEMMGLAKQPEPPKPCQGMTFDCIAKMGCTTTAALLPDRALDAPMAFRDIVPYSRLISALHGRDIGPEPDPPTILG